jgi:2,4-diaminopentanoate dehydrogenase
MLHPTRVIQFGLGPIGSAVARHILERSALKLVGAVDIALAKVGKDTGEVLGLDRRLGIPVSGSLAEALAHGPADVVTHCTGSYADLFTPQILEILGAGLSVVSTSEELSFPWLAHAAEAKLIDDAARSAGRAVLATGVNPGFLMDTLPLTLTAICQRVDHITVTRTQNASNRRGPFQAKIGSGMTVDEFRAKMAAGRMGHVGLVESAGMVLSTLGKQMVRFETSVEPVVTEKPVKTPYFNVAPGRVRGLRQVAHAYAPEGEFLTLVFVAALDEATDQDVVTIEGKPTLEVTLKGTNGDIATVAITVNAIRRVLAAQPGLATMADLPVITAW